jgi:Carboxypeptidase regulatory-like domain
MRIALLGTAWLSGALLFGQTGLSLAGTVEDASGAPIPNIVIALLTSESDLTERYIVHTDAAGSYRFAGLKPGTYRVELQAPGFVPASIGSIPVSPERENFARQTVLQSLPNASCSRDVYPHEIRLLPIGSNRGSIAGLLRISRPPSNTRVTGSRKVQIMLQDGGREITRIESQERTFRFPDLHPGKYRVQITGTGIYSETWDVTVRQDLETQYEFPLSVCRDRSCDPELRFKGEPILICQ